MGTGAEQINVEGITMAYNGWKNFETWNMVCHLLDDNMQSYVEETYEEEYRERLDYLDITHDESFLNTPKYIRVHAIQETSECLQNAVYDILYSEGYTQEGNYIGEMVETFMDAVDWYEIVETWTEDNYNDEEE